MALGPTVKPYCWAIVALLLYSSVFLWPQRMERGAMWGHTSKSHLSVPDVVFSVIWCGRMWCDAVWCGVGWGVGQPGAIGTSSCYTLLHHTKPFWILCCTLQQGQSHPCTNLHTYIHTYIQLTMLKYPVLTWPPEVSITSFSYLQMRVYDGIITGSYLVANKQILVLRDTGVHP